MDEKRKHVRVPLVIKVTNNKTKEFHFFYSKDISIGGMFLETRDPYEIGGDVELDFFLPVRGHKERVVIVGKVVRVIKFDPVKRDNQAAAGMGIGFGDIDGQSMAHISTFIRETLGSTED